jgi:hypothetical protein
MSKYAVAIHCADESRDMLTRLEAIHGRLNDLRDCGEKPVTEDKALRDDMEKTLTYLTRVIERLEDHVSGWAE